MFHSAQSHKQLWCHVESIRARNPSPALFSQLHFLLWRSSLLYKLSEKQTNKEVYTKIKGNGMIGQWQKTTKARKYTDKCQMHPLDPSICFTTANLKDSSFLTFRMPPAVSRFDGIWYYLLLVPGVDFTTANGCILWVGEDPLHKTIVAERDVSVAGKQACWPAAKIHDPVFKTQFYHKIPARNGIIYLIFFCLSSPSP